MKITEGNKLIAEFMGAKINPKWQDETTYTFPVAPTKHSSYHWTANTMAYNESWDWLMPVVEKIEDVKTIGQRCYITIDPFKISGYCSGVLEKKLSVFSIEFSGKHFNDEEKKKVVWDIVIEFIKWYNITPKN